MTEALADRFAIIDTDSHVSEPDDLWTSRVPKKWVDLVPRVRQNPANGHPMWQIGDLWGQEPGWFAFAGWSDYPPRGPMTLEDIGVDRASWDPAERLRRLDEFGIYAQLLYPNVIAFELPLMMKLGLDIALACVEAWNDFITEFASADTRRLIPLTMLPFWDVTASRKEMERSRRWDTRGSYLPQNLNAYHFLPSGIRIGMSSTAQPKKSGCR